MRDAREGCRGDVGVRLDTRTVQVRDERKGRREDVGVGVRRNDAGFQEDCVRTKPRGERQNTKHLWRDAYDSELRGERDGEVRVCTPVENVVGVVDNQSPCEV